MFESETQTAQFTPQEISFLETELLPSLFQRNSSQNPNLRLWLAGIDEGLPAYLLAIMLCKLTEEYQIEPDLKIFATSQHEQAIQLARRGVYSSSALDPLPEEYREQFFEPYNYNLRVKTSIRYSIIFGCKDLPEGSPAPELDLFLCRYSLAEYSLEEQRTFLRRVSLALAARQGYIMLRPGESLPEQLLKLEGKISYRPVEAPFPLYQCFRVGYSSPANEVAQSKLAPIAKFSTETTRPITLQSNYFGPASQWKEELFKIWSEEAGLVLLNRNYQILETHGTEAVLPELALAAKNPTRQADFLHSLPELPYYQTREAIDRTFETGQVVSLKQVELNSTPIRYLSLTLRPLLLDEAEPELLVIHAKDITEIVVLRQRLEKLEAELLAAQAENRHNSENTQPEYSRLMEELIKANLELEQSNLQLGQTNEALQVSNEELLLMHEELQSTMEELEATNEELEATNEELQFTMEKLKNKQSQQL